MISLQLNDRQRRRVVLFIGYDFFRLYSEPCLARLDAIKGRMPHLKERRRRARGAAPVKLFLTAAAFNAERTGR